MVIHHSANGVPDRARCREDQPPCGDRVTEDYAIEGVTCPDCLAWLGFDGEP